MAPAGRYTTDAECQTVARTSVDNLLKECETAYPRHRARVVRMVARSEVDVVKYGPTITAPAGAAAARYRCALNGMQLAGM